MTDRISHRLGVGIAVLLSCVLAGFLLLMFTAPKALAAETETAEEKAQEAEKPEKAAKERSDEQEGETVVAEEEEPPGPQLEEAIRLEQCGLSIKPPLGWRIDESATKGNTAVLVGPVSQRTHPSIRIIRVSGSLPDARADLLVDYMAKKVPGSRLVSREVVEDVPGGMAILVVLQMSRRTKKLPSRLVCWFAQVNDTQLLLMTDMPLAMFGDFMPTVKASFSSVEVFGPGFDRRRDGTMVLRSMGVGFSLGENQLVEHRSAGKDVVEFVIETPAGREMVVSLATVEFAGSHRDTVMFFGPAPSGSGREMKLGNVMLTRLRVESRVKADKRITMYYVSDVGKQEKLVCWFDTTEDTFERSIKTVEPILSSLEFQ